MLMTVVCSHVCVLMPAWCCLPSYPLNMHADVDAHGAGHWVGHNEEWQEHDTAKPYALDGGGNDAPHCG